MGDLDISGIEDILQQAARIRADIRRTYAIKPNTLYGNYTCNGCGEENSLLSSWCVKCGLRKNEQTKKDKYGVHRYEKPKHKHFGCTPDESTFYTVYNTDQLLQDLKSPEVPNSIHKPREINTAKGISRGEVMVYKYNQPLEDTQMIGVREVQAEKITSHNESMELPIFGHDDIILYDRGENKKSKKKLYIKPLSTPSLIPTTDTETLKNAWSSPVQKQERARSTTDIKTSNLSRPSSASKLNMQVRPSSATRRSQPSRTQRRPSSACSKRSLNNSSTPSVFERLYNNESKLRTRSIHSSPHLLAVDNNKTLKTSTVAIASPQLSLQTTEKKFKLSLDERHIICTKKKNIKSTFPKQMCATPLTVNGIRSSLPSKYPLKAYYRVQEGSPQVAWMSLPAEIWVKIMQHMSHRDLCELAASSSYLHHVSADRSIWDTIVVSNKDLQDRHVAAIGEKCPRYLTFSCCNGTNLTSTGLRSLFRSCASSLKGFTVTDCKGGELVTSSLLLHLSARCQNLSRLHMSLCNIGDESLTQLAQRASRLERVCIPMCSGITDISFRVLLQRHYRSLTCLDITGCYHISPSAISQISLCPGLSAVYLGNCNQITSSTLRTLSEKCDNLKTLDIRGCKNVSSDSVVALLSANPHIHTLSLSHVTMVTDSVLERISNTLLSLSVLDLSGCIKVTSVGIQHLTRHPVKMLDVGSTAVSFRGCCAIANYLSCSLQQVSFNFCSDINDECVRKIVQKCKKLERVSVFGCRFIRNFEGFSKINPRLVLEF